MNARDERIFNTKFTFGHWTLRELWILYNERMVKCTSKFIFVWYELALWPCSFVFIRTILWKKRFAVSENAQSIPVPGLSLSKKICIWGMHIEGIDFFFSEWLLWWCYFAKSNDFQFKSMSQNCVYFRRKKIPISLKIRHSQSGFFPLIKLNA